MTIVTNPPDFVSRLRRASGLPTAAIWTISGLVLAACGSTGGSSSSSSSPDRDRPAEETNAPPVLMLDEPEDNSVSGDGSDRTAWGYISHSDVNSGQSHTYSFSTDNVNYSRPVAGSTFAAEYGTLTFTRAGDQISHAQAFAISDYGQNITHDAEMNTLTFTGATTVGTVPFVIPAGVTPITVTDLPVYIYAQPANTNINGAAMVGAGTLAEAGGMNGARIFARINIDNSIDLVEFEGVLPSVEPIANDDAFVIDTAVYSVAFDAEAGTLTFEDDTPVGADGTVVIPTMRETTAIMEPVSGFVYLYMNATGEIMAGNLAAVEAAGSVRVFARLNHDSSIDFVETDGVLFTIANSDAFAIDSGADMITYNPATDTLGFAGDASITEGGRTVTVNAGTAIPNITPQSEVRYLFIASLTATSTEGTVRLGSLADVTAAKSGGGVARIFGTLNPDGIIHLVREDGQLPNPDNLAFALDSGRGMMSHDGATDTLTVMGDAVIMAGGVTVTHHAREVVADITPDDDYPLYFSASAEGVVDAPVSLDAVPTGNRIFARLNPDDSIDFVTRAGFLPRAGPGSSEDAFVSDATVGALTYDGSMLTIGEGGVTVGTQDVTIPVSGTPLDLTLPTSAAPVYLSTDVEGVVMQSALDAVTEGNRIFARINPDGSIDFVTEDGVLPPAGRGTWLYELGDEPPDTDATETIFVRVTDSGGLSDTTEMAEAITIMIDGAI